MDKLPEPQRKIRIGSQHREYQDHLDVLLVRGELTVQEMPAKERICWSCGKRTEEKAWELREIKRMPQGYNGESRYYISDNCYQQMLLRVETKK
jgi:hypothetical protein